MKAEDVQEWAITHNAETGKSYFLVIDDRGRQHGMECDASTTLRDFIESINTDPETGEEVRGE